MSTFITREDGYFALTKPGYIALVILMLIIMFLTAFIVDKKQNAKKFQAKQLAFAGIALALAFITSYIKYELPMGGSLTLFSMFFICYIGYLYGIKVGLIRPKTLWPFPVNAFKEIDFNTTKHIISVELSQGQMIYDVKLAVECKLPVSLINRVGGMLLDPQEIVDRTKKIMEVK